MPPRVVYDVGLLGVLLPVWSGELWSAKGWWRSIHGASPSPYMTDMLTYTRRAWHCWRLIHTRAWSSLCWRDGKRTRWTSGRNCGRVLRIRLLRCWRGPTFARNYSFKKLHRRLPVVLRCGHDYRRQNLMQPTSQLSWVILVTVVKCLLWSML